MASKAISERQQKRLRGKQLLKRLKDLTALSKSEKAKACGYVKLSKNGKERVQIAEFMNAILEAKGVALEVGSRSNGHRGRGLNHRVTVQKNGAIIVSAGYTQQMGFTPGQPFEIKLGRKSIKLTAIEPETEEGFDDSSHEDEEFDSDEIE